MAALERAGHVSISKTSSGRGGSTTYRLTPAGRTAYDTHRAALREILDAD